jgi:serine/threonine protein kinase
VEERRLHLNVRPEAFVIKDAKGQERLPKYSFFHFPKQFLRSGAVPSLNREFVLVDHLDTSVDVADRGSKGLGTVGSWLFVPPEVIMQLLKSLREDYARHVQEKEPADPQRTIRLKRSQMDDIWALGLTLYQFVTEGRLPFRDPKSLTDMINAILLSKFDFSHMESRIRTLLEAMLQKDPGIRFQKVFEGCPEKIKTRKVMAEAILYRLELLALEESS